jgi:hypothetical protein
MVNIAGQLSKHSFTPKTPNPWFLYKWTLSNTLFKDIWYLSIQAIQLIVLNYF